MGRPGRFQILTNLRFDSVTNIPMRLFERTLHYVRDHEAEERRERALNELASIFAKSVVDDLIAEESRRELEKPNVAVAESDRGRPLS
jgi:hypothetical protein